MAKWHVRFTTFLRVSSSAACDTRRPHHEVCPVSRLRRSYGRSDSSARRKPLLLTRKADGASGPVKTTPCWRGCSHCQLWALA
ncbi:hypothetical protein EDB89DRAFT_2036542 [Lactarius sanguifluus]|nr:hypothetical protein EDB89DRAFT_2036542 [Lactarius sanguifluus]